MNEINCITKDFCHIWTLNQGFSLTDKQIDLIVWKKTILTEIPFELSQLLVFALSSQDYLDNRAATRLNSSVLLQMSPQITCVGRRIVTLVAFIWLFSTVCCQMSPQTVCPSGCIVTVVAFVWLFSTMGFQMSPQISCPRRGKVTLVAYV